MITPKALVPAKIVENVTTTQYTVPERVTAAIIDKFTMTNYSAGAITVSVYLVTSGDTSGSQNQIVKDYSIAAGATYTFSEITGQVLNSGDFISTIASAAISVNMRVSGREVT